MDQSLRLCQKRIMRTDNPSRKCPQRRRQQPAAQWRRSYHSYILASLMLRSTTATGASFVPVRSSRNIQQLVQRPEFGIGTMNRLSHPSPPLGKSPRHRQRPLHRNAQSTLQMSSSKNIEGINEENNNDNNNNNNDNNGSGMYLDEETYLQAEENLLRSDGSLNFDETRERFLELEGRGMTAMDPSFPPMPRVKNKTYQTAVEGLFSPPPSYSYSNNNGGGGGSSDSGGGINQRLSMSQQQLSDEEQLYQAVTDIQNGDKPTPDPESLHQQVFNEERTYFEQSKEFRKSLSSLYDSEAESPMAKERREVIEQYNESVLDDLMKEMDKMEELAVPREDALRDARSEGQPTDDGDGKGNTMGGVVCSECGLGVTPDAIERANIMIDLANKGGGVKKTNGLVCQACYSKKLRTFDESRLRSAYGQPTIFDKFDKQKKARQSSWKKNKGSEGYNNNNSNSNNSGGSRRKSGRFGDRQQDGRTSSSSGSVRGMDTSSLFEMPKKEGYDAGPRSGSGIGSTSKKIMTPPQRAMDAKSSRPKSSSTLSSGPSSSYEQQRSRPPPRRTSRMLGGRELAKRMQLEQDSKSMDEGDDDLKLTAAREDIRKVSPMRKVSFEEDNSKEVEDDVGAAARGGMSAQKQDGGRVDDSMLWIKVEDPGTKRMFYWNTETGEMKNTLD